MTDSHLSVVRIMRIVTVSQWLALSLGIIAAIVISGGTVEAYAAAATGGLYVLVMTAMPDGFVKRPLVLESISLSGALLTMTSVALTGGVQSPYLLLSFIPAISATVLGGTRSGLATGLLSASLLVAMSLTPPASDLMTAIGLAALIVIVALTVGQIRRILQDIERRATRLEEDSVETTRRLEELAASNDLLTRLAALTSENTGPISVGRTALETITAMIPRSAGSALLTSEEGSVVIAQHGDMRAAAVRTRIPLMVENREVGAILLASDDVLTDTQSAALDSVLKPLALSFANLLLLQQIARTAVKEERSRLARELHDEIGPTLASLGLALDTAALQAGEHGLADHLGQLRHSVSSLVDDVRSTVADLRTTTRGSLTNRLSETVHQLDPPPTIDIGLDERRPPRPSILDDIAAIVIEAVRNAHTHSGSDRVRVHGWIDYERGRVVVEDRGEGFEISSDHPGHYGLVGMQERAERIDARLLVTSDQGGTTVALEWGKK